MLHFHRHQVRELAWALEGPGLLSRDFLGDRIEDDLSLRGRLHAHKQTLFALEADPSPLLEFLTSIPTYNRLGRYFEALLRYFLLEMEKVDRLEANIAIRGPKQTLGELDLVYRATPASRPCHWEASVKFYLCTAETEEEAKLTNHFMGTLVEDRLDRKLKKLLSKQLTLPVLPETEARLKELGLENPESRALMKGFFYYPSHTDWRNHPHPPEVSKTHARGWWTTSSRLILPRTDSDSRYILLDPARWLAPFLGFVAPDEILTHDRLTELIKEYFAGPLTPHSLLREMMVAEVVREESGASCGASDSVRVRERSRGNILHAEWTTHARASALLP